MYDLFRIFLLVKKRKWLEYLLELLYVYNVISYLLIMYSFYFFMFGREVRFLIDLFLGEDEEVDENLFDWLVIY